MNLGAIGRSPAGQRIWAAGLKPDEPKPESLRPCIVVSAPDEDTWRPPVSQIIHEVAEKHGLRARDIRGPRRLRRIVAARLECYYRAVMETDLSLVRIGRVIGRDHSCVINGVRRYALLNNLPLPRGMHP